MTTTDTSLPPDVWLAQPLRSRGLPLGWPVPCSGCVHRQLHQSWTMPEPCTLEQIWCGWFQPHAAGGPQSRGHPKSIISIHCQSPSDESSGIEKHLSLTDSHTHQMSISLRGNSVGSVFSPCRIYSEQLLDSSGVHWKMPCLALQLFLMAGYKTVLANIHFFGHCGSLDREDEWCRHISFFSGWVMWGCWH